MAVLSCVNCIIEGEGVAVVAAPAGSLARLVPELSRIGFGFPGQSQDGSEKWPREDDR